MYMFPIVEGCPHTLVWYVPCSHSGSWRRIWPSTWLASQFPFQNAEEWIRMLLHIALQDGFFRDSVRIVVSGREIFSKSQVTTRRQTGYADSVEVDAKEPEVPVDISLPARDIAKRIAVTVTHPTYLGVSLTSESEISWKISADPFGYL